MSAPLAHATPRSSDPVLIAVPLEAVPAVVAVIEAVRASATSAGTKPFGDRLALTVPQTAQALGLSVGTVRSLLRRGDLSSISFGRATRITVQTLGEYLDRRSDEAEVWARPTPLRRRG